MAGKKKQSKTQTQTQTQAAAAAVAAAALSPEESVAQSVMQHYAKTVYFNDLWVSFLGKMAGLVFLVSFMSLQDMYYSDAGLQFIAGFEVLSIFIALATTIFIRRFFDSLLAFKAAFAFSLLEVVWFGTSYAKRRMGLPRDAGDLSMHQLPFGVIYFLVCWAADRFMVRSTDVAKQAATGIQDVLQQKTKTQ
jgi:hypothetical protein